MDQKIFDQLDKLERGSRLIEDSRQGAYNDSSADYSAYEGRAEGYEPRGDPACHPQHYSPYYQPDDFADQPLTLDSFDEQLLRQPDCNSRYGQAAAGRARLSLPQQNAPTLDYPGVHNNGSELQLHRNMPSQRSDLSRFAFEGSNAGGSSSSPFHQPMPSSPAFEASQRHPALMDLGRRQRPILQTPYAEEMHQPPGYQALSAEDLEAEDGQMKATNFETAGPAETFKPQWTSNRPSAGKKSIQSSTPLVQGIRLVSTRELPDRFRSIFSYPVFNAVQSKCFQTVYRSSDNLVLSAPTGGGKTAVLELAICSLVNGFASGSYKIVYQAPTKSLCAERQRDWQAKFAPLGLQCAELTGDTDHAQLRNIQNARIIITTPEKWDSVTRKWKDHQKLMQMVKLFLIDEVHILKESRGATLEAVVSRMKSVGSNVRLVALSATVPNSDDIATWLGKDPVTTHLPAAREVFGEEFRPVKLQKHVVGYSNNNPNDFALDKTLSNKLPEVIAKYSQKKPIMVFCFTRGACVETAKLLANWWATKSPRDRAWGSPSGRLAVEDKDLRNTVSSGVAFHHAGLSVPDRNAVERGYLAGEVNVICCTSTLAVGVNLPCHMVIIKNTVTYQQGTGCKELSDLEIMQMLGRAGRPQFDESAVAVIMTRSERVRHYEDMITGHEVLESCLHLNLIDHLNAEIALGTITSASSAKDWLTSTFFYLRMKENPEHYKIQGDAPGRNIDERLENVCAKGIAALEGHELIKADPNLQSTEFGDAMARYYLQFETMKNFLDLPPAAKSSEILSAIAQAAEFGSIRFRQGEKPIYKELNKNGSIKFPIPDNIDRPAHKVSLVIQAVLGALDLPTEDNKHLIEFRSVSSHIFQHVHRMVRCIIDCKHLLDDATSTRNALMLSCSLGAQVWDDSPLHIKQLEGIGPTLVRKIVNANIRSIEELEEADAHRIEYAVSRNPPFGTQLQQKAKVFPRLQVSVKLMGEPSVKRGEHVTIHVKAEIAFLNDAVPEFFAKKPVYVCLLAEVSDGRKAHFARISAKKLGRGQEILFSAMLTTPKQTVRVYVMCDEIAGTMRSATLKPGVPAASFPPPKVANEKAPPDRKLPAVTTSKRRNSTNASKRSKEDSDEFGDAGIRDDDLARAADDGFMNIDQFENARRNESPPKQKKRKVEAAEPPAEEYAPQRLPNGNWACNHRCKDRTACKHICCREGTENKPKPPKGKDDKEAVETKSDPKQTQLTMSSSKQSVQPARLPEKNVAASQNQTKNESKEARSLERIAGNTKTKTPRIKTISKDPRKAFLASGQKGGQRSNVVDNPPKTRSRQQAGGDHADLRSSEDFPDVSEFVQPRKSTLMPSPKTKNAHAQKPDRTADIFKKDDLMDGLDDLDDLFAGNDIVDLSSYADDFNTGTQASPRRDGKMAAMIRDSPGQKSGVASRSSPSKDKHLFMGYSTDSPAHKAVAPSIDTFARADVQQTNTSKFFAVPKQHEPPSDIASAKTAVESHAPRTTDARAVQFGTTKEQDEQCKSDEIRAWFEAEYGTELFHLVD